jgi:hypothetical protein
MYDTQSHETENMMSPLRLGPKNDCAGETCSNLSNPTRPDKKQNLIRPTIFSLYVSLIQITLVDFAMKRAGNGTTLYPLCVNNLILKNFTRNYDCNINLNKFKSYIFWDITRRNPVEVNRCSGRAYRETSKANLMQNSTVSITCMLGGKLQTRASSHAVCFACFLFHVGLLLSVFDNEDGVNKFLRNVG